MTAVMSVDIVNNFHSDNNHINNTDTNKNHTDKLSNECQFSGIEVFSIKRSGREQLNEENLPVIQFLDSVQSLLLKYRMYSKAPNNQVSSGGLQQLITKKMKEKVDENRDSLSVLSDHLRVLYSKSESVSFGVDQEDLGYINYLPVNLKLKILSYLDARSLCSVCCLNREWNQLGCDEMLWQCLLQDDMQRWPQMSHTTNPMLYLEINSELSYKEIYLRCSPKSHKHLQPSSSTFFHVSSFLRNLLPRKIPKVAMLGPGLEQSTSGLVRRILYEDNQMFTRVAMFPGQFDGVGGGITLKLQSGHSLHLSVLYSASQQEREQRGAQERLQRNRMLQQRHGGDAGADDGSDPVYELKSQIKHLCHTLDGLIFVVDASVSLESVTKSRGEFMAVVKELRPASHVPVLVLACIKDEDSQRLAACQLVDALLLSTISHPWLVIDCVSQTLQSVDTGVVWLVDQAQFK